MRTSRTALLAVTAAATLGLAACDSGADPAATPTSPGVTTSNTASAGDASSSAPETAASTTGPATSAATGPAAQGAVPKNLDARTQGLVANPDGAAGNVMGIYMDPQCPACRQAEQLTSGAVDKAAQAKTARIVFHPMTFLDDMLHNDSSKVMANAVACASDHEGKLLPYVREMYAAQPAKEGDGYAKDAPGAIADKAGLTGAGRTTFDTCVKENRYDAWIAKAQDQYTKDGVKGTPTYLHNGSKIDLQGFTVESFAKKLAGEK